MDSFVDEENVCRLKWKEIAFNLLSAFREAVKLRLNSTHRLILKQGYSLASEIFS